MNVNVNQLIRGLLVIVLTTVLSCDRKSEESAKPNDVPAVLSPEVTLENGHVTLDWKKALYFDHFYEVPFELNGKVARPVSEKMGMNEGRSRLLYSRKSTDKAVFVVNYIPSKAFKGDINAVNTQNFLSLKFDGRITLSRIGDNTLRVLEINNGKVTKDAKHQKVSRQDAGRARTSGCELWVDTIEWYTCSGGECHYNYTAQEYYYVCTGDPFGGNDYTGGTSNGDCSSDPVCNGYGIGAGAPIPLLDGNTTLSGRPGQKPDYVAEDRCNFASNIWNRSVASNKEHFGVVTKNGQYLITQEQGFSGGTIDGIYKGSDGRVFYYYPVNNEPPFISGSEPARIGGQDVWAIEIKATVHTHTPCLSDGTDGISQDVGDDDHNLASTLYSLHHYVIGCNATAEFNSTESSFYNLGGGCLIIYAVPSRLRL